MISKKCSHCGTEFEAQRSNAKYCRQSCRTMASNTKNGFKIGRIRIKEKDIASVNPPTSVPLGMNGMETARAKDELTLVGTLEGFIGAGAANLITQLLTSGEYDERLALLQKTLNQVLYELQQQGGGNKNLSLANKVMNIPKMRQQKNGMQLIEFPNEPMM